MLVPKICLASNSGVVPISSGMLQNSVENSVSPERRYGCSQLSGRGATCKDIIQVTQAGAHSLLKAVSHCYLDCEEGNTRCKWGDPSVAPRSHVVLSECQLMEDVKNSPVFLHGALFKSYLSVAGLGVGPCLW